MNMNNLKKSCLICSFLLQYPDVEWMETLQEVYEEAEKLKDKIVGKPMLKFLDYIKEIRVLDLAELYVRTFDFSKNTNLYLTYYEFKEDRKRGDALLAIKGKYEEAGFNLSLGELPDYLPAMLEFIAYRGEVGLLVNYKAAINMLFNNLTKINSPYAYVLEAVLLLLQEYAINKPERAEMLGGVAK